MMMYRRLIVIWLVVLARSSSCSQLDWSKADGAGIYAIDKSDCVFPFTYNNVQYNDCTIDGDNGRIPWCALTSKYQGVFTYCYDFRNTSLKCQESYTINGKTYNGCAFLRKTALYKQCKPQNSDLPLINCPDAMNKPKTNYINRRRDCDERYKALSDSHTMCFAPSDFAVRVNITLNEQNAILDIHNQYRAAVPSKHMFKLYWDDGLAALAQARSDLCGFDHDLADNRMTLEFGWKNGQNMVMSGETGSSLASLIDMMLGAEKEAFFYGVGCNPAGNCLHYTQAMIDNITAVGCAQTHCVYTDRIERFLTCNYLFSQYTSKYTKPYITTTAADAASRCPNVKTSDGLCDCGKTICRPDLNEYLEPETCQCKKDLSKRSLNKRDAELASLAVKGGDDLLEDSKKKKRSFNVISRHGSGGKAHVNKREAALDHGSVAVKTGKHLLEDSEKKKRSLNVISRHGSRGKPIITQQVDNENDAV